MKKIKESFENIIESLSIDLCDSILESHLGYFRYGMQLGARIVTELII